MAALDLPGATILIDRDKSNGAYILKPGTLQVQWVIRKGDKRSNVIHRHNPQDWPAEVPQALRGPLLDYVDAAYAAPLMQREETPVMEKAREALMAAAESLQAPTVTRGTQQDGAVQAQDEVNDASARQGKETEPKEPARSPADQANSDPYEAAGREWTRTRDVDRRVLLEQKAKLPRYLAGKGWDSLDEVEREAIGRAMGFAPTYAQRKVLNAEAIIAWAKEQGFKTTLAANKLHVTIAYSKMAMDPLAVGNQSPAYTKGVITGKAGRAVERLGDEGAVVLKFDSPVLATRFKQWRQAGASWDFESFQPHITITYEPGDVDLSKVEPYTGPIELGPEVVEPIKPREERQQATPEASAGAASSPETKPQQATPEGQPRDPESGQFVNDDDEGFSVGDKVWAKPGGESGVIQRRIDERTAMVKWDARGMSAHPLDLLTKKAPATPQVPNEPGTKYVLPGFVTAGAARTPAPSADTVKVPPTVDAALTADLQKQQARVKRLRSDADGRDMVDLEGKKAAQLKVTAAETTLRKMRTSRFDAEDAAVKAVADGNFKPFEAHEDLFPSAADALRALMPPVPGSRVTNPDGSYYTVPKDEKLQKAKRPAKYEAFLDELQAYFQPGAIVPSYGGHDRVIQFKREDERGGWSVQVRAVVKQGDTWVDDPKDNRDRWHTTQPSEKQMQAGPTVGARAAARPANPPSRRPQPGEPGYTLLDARNDLIEMRTRLADQDIQDDRLAERVRQQERVVRDMEAAAEKPAAPKVSENTIVTDDMAEKARARLRSKLGRLGSNIDPETMLDGITLALYHVERGARTFAAYAKAMVADLGDGARPYLKSWYMGVKYDPRASAFAGSMSSPAMVDEFDVNDVEAPSDSNVAQQGDTGEQDASSPATRDLDRPGTSAPQGAPAGDVRAPDGQRAPGAAPAGRSGGDGPRDADPDAPGGDVAGGVGADARAPVSGPRAGRRGQDAGARRVPGAPRPDAKPGLFDDAGREGAAGGLNPAPNAPPIGANQPTAEEVADFIIEDDLGLGEGGQKTKFRNNIAALRIVKELQSDPSRVITHDEQRTLAKYVGWGGLPQAFDPDNQDWAKEHAELKGLLSDEEFAAARRSTRYAHYTSREIIQDGIYAALRRFGFNGGRVLEGGAGVGNFIGLMPTDMRSAGRVTAIEREPIAATIARALYPLQSVQLADFTEFRGTDGYFDAAVGNPPFASDTQVDRSGRKHLNGLSLHNYFFAKEVDMLREGGILAQVVTNSFLDAAGDKARKYIAERTRFLGAIRLPNNAFSKNAGTEVTTDLIFLQKLPESQWGSKKAKEAAAEWLESLPYTDPRKPDAKILLNRYFHNHPEMMLGDFGAHGTMYGPDQPALVARPGQDTLALLREAVAKLPEAVYVPASKVGTDDAVDAAVQALKNPPVQEGGYFMEGGKLLQRLPDIAGEARGKEITPQTMWTAKTTLGDDGYDRIVRLSELRGTLRALLASEMNGDAGMEVLRSKLGQQYDAYVSKHGLINDRGTARVFDDDPDFPLLLSLEHNYVPPVGPAEAKRMGIKPVKSRADKSPIFTQRVVERRKQVRKVDSPADAINVSMAERGRLDAAYIGELLGKSAEDVLRELSGGEQPLLFLDPASNEYVLRDAYLSGNVRAKLAQAKDANLPANVRALEEVQPKDVGAHEISAKIGAPWVPVQVYEEFARELLGDGAKASITYTKLNSSYSVYVSGASEVNQTNKWGTPHYSASELLSALLNNRTIRVMNPKDSEGRTSVNQEATENANIKAQEIRDRFQDWLFSDAERSEVLVRAYNDTNNNYVTRKYDGSWLTFPGKVPDSIRKPRRHQRNAVARIVQDRTALLDHVVGAGKTDVVVMASMELRRTGLSKKPMIAVPNHLVKQWAADFYRLYPGAKILTATKKDFDKLMRRRFLAKAATGDWDAVIIAHSSFGFIQPGAEFEAAFNEKQIALIKEAILDVHGSDAEEAAKKRTVKQLEGMVERLEKRIVKLRNKPMDALLDFEELGVDQLFVDEAHMFKNLMYTTKLQGVAGLQDPEGSKRAYDMYVKTQEVMDKNGRGQGVVFATGTPVSNSLAEKYHMMRYLMPRQMEELGFQSFDAWANTFAEVTQVWMQRPSGDGFKAQNRMSNFVNVHELLKLFDQVADTVTNEDIKKAEIEEGRVYPLPPLKTGRRQPISLEKSPAQDAYMQDIARRAAIIEARKGPPKKGDDNILVLMTDARKAAMDIRLVDFDITEREKGGRIDRAADEILTRYQKYNDVKGTQLVFADLGTPIKHAKAELKEYEALMARINAATDEVRERAALGAEDAQLVVDGAEDAAAELDAMGPDWLTAVKAALRGFSVYDDLKAALVERGVPEHEVAFIHDYNTDEQKAGLFRKVNSGAIRVLVGSTPKMGAGTNVQERLVAEHHLDVPWRPSDVEQREGRIIRQGNKLLDTIPGFEVEILAYVTRDTLDMRMWQIQEVKLKLINQLRTRQIERDIENAFEDAEMSASEMQAAATGNMDLLTEIQLRNDVKKLEGKRRSFEAQKNDLISRRKSVAAKLQKLPKEIEAAERAEKFAKEYMAVLESERAKFKVTIDGKEYTDQREASAYLLSKTDAKHYVRTVEKDGKKVREELTSEEYDKLAGELAALRAEGKADDTPEVQALIDKTIGFESRAAPLDVTMNGETYTARAKLAEAFSNARGDANTFVWEFGGKTHVRRSTAALAAQPVVAESIADEKPLELGKFGPFTLTVEGQPPRERRTFGREKGEKVRSIEALLQAGDTKISGTWDVDGEGATALKIAETVLDWAHGRAVNAGGGKQYLQWDLQAAKKAQADLDKAEDMKDWPDQPKLEEARAKHQEVLRRLNAAKGGGAKPAATGGNDAPAFQQGVERFPISKEMAGEMAAKLDIFVTDPDLYEPAEKKSPGVVEALRGAAARLESHPGGLFDATRPVMEVMLDEIENLIEMDEANAEDGDEASKRELPKLRKLARDIKASFRQDDGPATGADAAKAARLQQFVDGVVERWERAPRVSVVRSIDAAGVPLPIQLEAARRRQRGGGSGKAVFYRGEVFLFADRIKDERDALVSVAHEVLGHAGLRGKFGPGLDGVLAEVETLRRQDVLEMVRRNGMDEKDPRVLRHAAEEVLAYMAQNQPTLGIVRRAIAAIRTWLRENVPGFEGMSLSDDELVRNFILPARRWVQGDGPRGGGQPTLEPAFSQDGPGFRTVQVDGVRRPDSNAAGKPIAPASQGMQAMLNFWRWFGDSKVVDANGRPLVVYHGTGNDFSEFDTTGIEGGSFFSTDPSAASMFASLHQEMTGEDYSSPVVYSTYLAIRNPMRVAAADVMRGEEHDFDLMKAAISRARAAGHDGMLIPSTPDMGVVADQWVAFRPEQIKSATGNVGQFDPDSPDIMFQQEQAADPRSYRDLIREALGELGDTPGKLHWWHKTVGTQYHLARKSPLFARVFNRVQDFLSDVSKFATEAANLAPTILPKLETLRDIAKTALSGADSRAISAPIFEGTLAWTRFEGRAVRVDDLAARFETATPDEMAEVLIRNGFPPGVIRMWQGQPIEQYQQAVTTAFQNRIIKPGIVWTPEELRSQFSLTDRQVGLYREFRAATDKSITDLAISDMLRAAGHEFDGLREAMLDTGDIGAAWTLLGQTIDQTIADQPERADVLNKLQAKLRQKAERAQELIARGYAPLSRFGNYTVDVVGANGERLFFSLYESRFEAARAARRFQELAAEQGGEFEGATVRRGTISEEEYKLFAGISPETIELFGEMLGLDATGDEAADKAFQAYLQLAKANRSAMKRLIHRKGIAGFSQDVSRVLAGFVYSNARLTSRNLHAGDIERAIKQMSDEEAGGDRLAGELKDHAIRLREYVNNPTEEAAALRGLLFAQYLGGSIASALVNMTQPFTMTLPYLSQFGGIQTAARHMKDALRVAWAKTTGDAALDAALTRAVEDGIVAPQEVHQLLAQAQGRGALKAGDGTRLGEADALANNALARLTLAWGKPFSTAELFNRRVTFVAAWKSAKDQGLSDARAFEFAEQSVIETQGLYNKGNRPRWARGAIGATLLTFKQYSIAYLELLERMWNAGEPGSQERAAGRRAVYFAIGVLLLAGGAGGLPFVEDVGDLIDGLMQRLGYNWNTEHRRREMLEAAFGRGLGHVLEKGVSGLPGVPIDVAGRLGMGNLLPATGALKKKDDRSRDMLEVLGPTGDLAQRVVRAGDMAARGDVIDAGLEVSPVAARNVAKAIDMTVTGRYDDRRGYKVLDTTGAEALSKFIGFQPTQVSRVQEADRTAQEMVALAKLREAEIAGEWAKAIADGKAAEGRQRAQEALAAWNSKNPGSPIRIKLQDVLKRAQNMRMNRAQRIEKAAPAEVRGEVRRLLSDQ